MSDNTSFVVRGGDFDDGGDADRVADRPAESPSGRHDYLGFRMCRLLIPLQQLAEEVNHNS